VPRAEPTDTQRACVEIGRDAEQKDNATDLVAAGTDLAGALAGGAFGMLSGPLGALGGAALGVAVQRAARAVALRLSRREYERVGATLLLIERDVAARHERDEQLRDDEFFDEHDGRRPDAEELLEGVLRLAAQTYEERKVPLLANLFSGVAHDANVAAADAQFLLRTAADLTYRQFVALAVVAHQDEHFRDLARARTLHDEGRLSPDPATLVELDDLGDRRLVGLRSGGKIVTAGTTFETTNSISSATVGYGAMHLLPAGCRLVRLTGADRIVLSERQGWVDLLRGELNE
jgi:hypothetical protein